MAQLLTKKRNDSPLDWDSFLYSYWLQKMALNPGFYDDAKVDHSKGNCPCRCSANLYLMEVHKLSQKPTIRIKRSNFEGTRLIPIQRQQPQDLRPWSLAAIVDELVISMLDTKAVFCMLNSNKKTTMFSDPKEVEVNYRCNSGNGVLRRLYEEQVRYKIYRIPVFRPSPVFVVYLKHLDDRLKKELSDLDRETKDFVMKEAIGRICEQVDKRFFLLSVKPLLQWRLEN